MMMSGSTGVDKRTSTPRRFTSSANQRVIAPMSARCGAVAAIATCPPRDFCISKSTTSCPRNAAVRAASKPAGPPPTITTFLRTADFSGTSNWVLCSCPAAIFTTQAILPVLMSRPTQPWLEPIHGRISASRPSRAFATRYGSAMSARTIDTMSAMPLPTTWSAWSRVIMRPVTMVGTESSRVTASLLGNS